MPDYVASVFVSHAHEDKPFVREVCACLVERGCRVWIDEDDLRVGDSLLDRICEAIDEADFVLAMISANSVDSGWCRKELELAVNDEIHGDTVVVLPVRMDDTPVPRWLRTKLYLDVRSMGPRQAADKIMESIDEPSPRRRWRQSTFSALSPVAQPVELPPSIYLPYN